MTESERMKYAQIYVSKLAQGINPLDDSEIVGNDVINNQHISRCFQFVATVLEKIVNGEYFLKRSGNGIAYPDADYLMKRFQFSAQGLTISELCSRINATKNEGSIRVSSTAITRWLKVNELVNYVDEVEGQRLVLPTLKGEKFGLSTEILQSRFGKHSSVILSEDAQRQVVKNVTTILQEHLDNMERRNEMRKMDWDPQQERDVIDMYNQGMSVQQIAAVTGRTGGAIRARLVKLGAMH